MNNMITFYFYWRNFLNLVIEDLYKNRLVDKNHRSSVNQLLQGWWTVFFNFYNLFSIIIPRWLSTI